MKQSRYAVHTLTDNGTNLLYSTAHGSFAALGNRAFSVFQSLAQKGMAEQDKDAEIISELSRLGFVVDDNVDELAVQHEIYRAAQQDRSTLVLVLAPTYACNLRCPYCYEKANAATWDKMGSEVEEAIYAFTEAVYKRDHFRELNVEWYGGEPSLVLDIVERISEHLIAWCDDQDIPYTSMMLTNGTNIGTEQAALIARCHVSQALVTVDGPEEVHNLRRPTVDGRNSYQAIMKTIGALRQQGVQVFVGSNVDKVNAPLFDDLRRAITDEHDVIVLPALLNDYHQEYGEGAFAAPDFDLFTHEEYAQATCEQFTSSRHRFEEYQALLAPTSLFCRGQLESYYGIDARGDVYKCDGWMGDGEHVLFNLLEGCDVQNLDTAPAYPFDDEECLACPILPICLGTCQWERECCGYPHHPLKDTIGDYLGAWHACISEERDLQSLDIPDDAVIELADPRETTPEKATQAASNLGL